MLSKQNNQKQSLVCTAFRVDSVQLIRMKASNFHEKRTNNKKHMQVITILDLLHFQHSNEHKFLCSHRTGSSSSKSGRGAV